MNTIFEKINISNPSLDIVALKKAANILKNDGLVAFPTETVYGLGANALKEEAVQKIYIAKGRPSDNPLIVHIADKNMVKELVKGPVDDVALRLMDKFWPGPLTIVFKKKNIIPKTTSGGLDTVAIRMPDNNIALALIKECGFPLAAPSANTSTKPSPTNANHVYEDLNQKIDMIIDGGQCGFGIESTVVEIAEDGIVILRPGSITKDMLEDVCKVHIDEAIKDKKATPKAPGMKYKHYAPNAEAILINGEDEKRATYIKNAMQKDKEKGLKSIVIACEQTKEFYDQDVLSMGDREDASIVAKNLFSNLRKCDELLADKVYIEAYKEEGIGLAIMNRLKKATSYKIIDV